MAVHMLMVYPYARFNSKGEFAEVHFQSWKPFSDEAKNGGKVSEEGEITIHLPPLTIRVEAPDLSALEAKAVALLRIHKEKVRAEHAQLMARMQFAENNLLRLSAPDVLDAGEGPKAKPIKPGNDDDNYSDYGPARF